MGKLAAEAPTCRAQGYTPPPSGAFAISDVGFADPLDVDEPSDQAITLTERQLARVVFIAAETGGRFEREARASDPVAWLFAPRVLFDGLAPVSACQDRENFIRAIILHGLSIGVDAEPSDIDALLVDEDLEVKVRVAAKRESTVGPNLKFAAALPA